MVIAERVFESHYLDELVTPKGLVESMKFNNDDFDLTEVLEQCQKFDKEIRFSTKNDNNKRDGE